MSAKGVYIPRWLWWMIIAGWVIDWLNIAFRVAEWARGVPK